MRKTRRAGASWLLLPHRNRSLATVAAQASSPHHAPTSRHDYTTRLNLLFSSVCSLLFRFCRVPRTFMLSPFAVRQVMAMGCRRHHPRSPVPVQDGKYSCSKEHSSTYSGGRSLAPSRAKVESCCPMPIKAPRKLRRKERHRVSRLSLPEGAE